VSFVQLLFSINFLISFSVTKRINDHDKLALAKPQADLDNAINQVKQLQNIIDTANVEITNARRYV
jgi:hypothetical protein